MIPESGITFLTGDHPVEIMQTRENCVRSVRIHNPLTSRGRRARGVAKLCGALIPRIRMFDLEAGVAYCTTGFLFFLPPSLLFQLLLKY